MSITTAQYLSIKLGDKIIPNSVYWHERAGQVVVVSESAEINKDKWMREAARLGYNHPNDIPVSELTEDTAWLSRWVHAHPIGEVKARRSLLPDEIESIAVSGGEKWFELWLP